MNQLLLNLAKSSFLENSFFELFDAIKHFFLLCNKLRRRTEERYEKSATIKREEQNKRTTTNTNCHRLKSERL